MAGYKSYANLGASIGDLDLAWQDRLEDAELLRAAGRYPTAISMGLYALEILLKFKICQRLDLRQLPRPFEIHELEDLMVLSGFSRALTQTIARPVHSNWTKIVLTSKELNEFRYRPTSYKSVLDSDNFFAQLIDPQFGVLPWLSNQP